MEVIFFLIILIASSWASYKLGANKIDESYYWKGYDDCINDQAMNYVNHAAVGSKLNEQHGPTLGEKEWQEVLDGVPSVTGNGEKIQSYLKLSESGQLNCSKGHTLTVEQYYPQSHPSKDDPLGQFGYLRVGCMWCKRSFILTI